MSMKKMKNILLSSGLILTILFMSSSVVLGSPADDDYEPESKPPLTDDI